ncbi:MAG: hypothetical protein D6706_15295 [Chloroflexi bacterium]|nr:MAG: hypothetical protein D6706_15295 [Chloroflexota bacterium]
MGYDIMKPILDLWLFAGFLQVQNLFRVGGAGMVFGFRNLVIFVKDICKYWLIVLYRFVFGSCSSSQCGSKYDECD